MRAWSSLLSIAFAYAGCAAPLADDLAQEKSNGGPRCETPEAYLFDFRVQGPSEGGWILPAPDYRVGVEPSSGATQWVQQDHLAGDKIEGTDRYESHFPHGVHLPMSRSQRLSLVVEEDDLGEALREELGIEALFHDDALMQTLYGGIRLFAHEIQRGDVSVSFQAMEVCDDISAGPAVSASGTLSELRCVRLAEEAAKLQFQYGLCVDRFYSRTEVVPIQAECHSDYPRFVKMLTPADHDAWMEIRAASRSKRCPG